MLLYYPSCLKINSPIHVCLRVTHWSYFKYNNLLDALNVYKIPANEHQEIDSWAVDEISVSKMFFSKYLRSRGIIVTIYIYIYIYISHIRHNYFLSLRLLTNLYLSSMTNEIHPYIQIQKKLLTNYKAKYRCWKKVIKNAATRNICIKRIYLILSIIG